MFYNLLNQYITERGLRSQTICDGIGVNKSWLSKLRKGSILPPNWKILHRLAQFLQLSPAEYQALCDAYRSRRLTPEQNDYGAAIHQMLGLSFSCLPDTPYPPDSSALQSGALLTGDGLRQAAAALVQSADSLRALIIPRAPAFRTLLCTAVSRAAPLIPMQLLTAFDNTAQSAVNLYAVHDIVPVLPLYHTAVRCIHMDVRQHLAHTLFPLMLASESHVLLLNTDCTEGICLENSAAEVWRRWFAEQYASAFPFIRLHRTLNDFLTACDTLEIAENTEVLYVLAKAPSLVSSATATEVHTYMNENALSEHFGLMLQNLIFSSKRMISLFWEQGIYDILSSPEYYEYGSALSQSISPEFRKKLLRDTVADYKTTQMLDFGIVRTAFPDNSEVIGLNIWSGGKMLILISSGDNYYIITMQEHGITSGIIQWIQTMRAHGLITGKEDAASFCEALL